MSVALSPPSALQQRWPSQSIANHLECYGGARKLTIGKDNGFRFSSGFGSGIYCLNSITGLRHCQFLVITPCSLFIRAKRSTVFAMASDLETVAKKSSVLKLMIVSDLDNTMVDHKDKDNSSLLQFNSLWERVHASDSLLVFSTGRSPALLKQLKEQVPLLTPDVAITSVGTEISYGSSLTPDRGWMKLLDEGWNRDIVVEEAKKFPQLRFQVESEQSPHKVSFHIGKEDAQAIISSMQKRLEERGLKVKLVYSGGYDLDVLPEKAGKGRAMAYLLTELSKLGKKPLATLACGDSGNDIELFTVEGAHGVIVGNAMDELLHWYDQQKDKGHVFKASERCASGIIQAMQFFKFTA